jgi:quercetin dioxygenase-like cupin family protein
MIRCVRIWTGDDRNSHFEEGVIDLEPGQRGDVLSGRMATTTISFEETAPGGAFAWHTAPIRQLVITLSGTLDFQTREGEHFLIRPGDILFAEDTAGSGHSWRLTDAQPWRRAYVILQPGTAVPFRASPKESRPDRGARDKESQHSQPTLQGELPCPTHSTPNQISFSSAPAS